MEHKGAVQLTYSALLSMSLTVVIFFGAIANAEAPKQSCSSLFETPNTVTRPSIELQYLKPNYSAKLRGLADSVRDQRHRGVNLSDTRIQVTKEVQETLSWMHTEISSKIEKNEFVLTSSQSQKYQEFLVKLGLMLRSDRIGYLEFLFQAQKFSVLVGEYKPLLEKQNLSEQDRQKRTKRLENTLNETPPHDIANFAESIRYAEQEAKWFLFPTNRNLGFRTLNIAHAEGIGLLGLTNKLMDVDFDRNLSPNRFFQHDLGHIMGFERGSSVDGYPTFEKLTIVERRNFFDHFEKWMEKKELSDSDKMLRQVVWFTFFHEYNYDLHPKVLSYVALKSLHYELKQNFDPVKQLERLVNTPEAFGHPFKGRKVSREEVINALTDLAEFAATPDSGQVLRPKNQ